jgi:pterin-4a-carbinolamine dehydratase
VGPAIEWESLERIGSYVGKSLQFPNFESAAAAMRLISEDSAHIAMSSGAGSRKP